MLKKSKGLGTAVIRTMAVLCLVIGLAGACIIQNGILGMGQLSGMELFEKMEADPAIMGYATAALVCQVIYACAAPLFAFLLVEGEHHTSDVKKYLIRVLGVALVAELPYNFATTGKLLDTGSLNPAFGLVMALVALCFFRRYSQSGGRNVVIRILVTLAAILWTMMLGIVDGAPLVLLTVVLWATREKPLWRNIAGCAAAAGCMLFSPFYILSPVAVIAIHLYNGEKSAENKWLKLAIYPLILLIFGLLQQYMF